MDKIIVENIEVRLASSPEEILALKKFRYQCLLKEYRHELSDDGIDDDGYDNFCEHLIAFDNKEHKIIGTYRLATYKTTKGHPFITEEEFDISNIKNTKENILELGRAVVHENYRNGVVIQLLWAAMLHYALENNIKYVLGMGSFHGIDVFKYKDSFSYLYYNYRSPRDIASHASLGPQRDMRMLEENEIDVMKAKEEMPALIKGYLRLGATISDDICLDLSFNSADVLVLLDMKKINPRYIERLTRA